MRTRTRMNMRMRMNMHALKAKMRPRITIGVSAAATVVDGSQQEIQSTLRSSGDSLSQESAYCVFFSHVYSTSAVVNVFHTSLREKRYDVSLLDEYFNFLIVRVGICRDALFYLLIIGIVRDTCFNFLIDVHASKDSV